MGDPLHLGFSAARAAKVKIKSKHLGAFAANRWPEATFGDQKPLVKGLCDRSFSCFFPLSCFWASVYVFAAKAGDVWAKCIVESAASFNRY